MRTIEQLELSVCKAVCLTIRAALQRGVLLHVHQWILRAIFRVSVQLILLQ